MLAGIIVFKTEISLTSSSKYYACTTPTVVGLEILVCAFISPHPTHPLPGHQQLSR